MNRTRGQETLGLPHTLTPGRTGSHKPTRRKARKNGPISALMPLNKAEARGPKSRPDITQAETES